MNNKYYKMSCLVSCLMGVNLSEMIASNSPSMSIDRKIDNTSLKNFDWSEQNIQNLLKNEGALSVCAKFSLFTKTELENMKDHIEWITDLFQDIQLKLTKMPEDMKTRSNILKKDIELMLAYYKDCFDELQHQEHQNRLIYATCIEHLKKLQIAIQNLRISINNILDTMRLLASKSENTAIYQDLQGAKREIKVADDHCISMVQTIDQVIKRLIPLIEFFHKCSFEERNREIYTNSSSKYDI